MFGRVVKILLVGFALLGSGCGGGGTSGDDTSNTRKLDNGNDNASLVSADGIWEGSYVERGLDYNVFAILYGGRMVAINHNSAEIYDARYKLSGSSIYGSGKIYSMLSTDSINAEFSGNVSEKAKMDITIVAADGSKVSVTLNYSSLTDQAISVSALAGNWGYANYAGTYSASITLENDGSFWGQDSDGCVYAGKIEMINSSVNILSGQGSVSNCGTIDGSYSGFAVYEPGTAGGNDNLHIAITGKRGVYFQLERR